MFDFLRRALDRNAGSPEAASGEIEVAAEPVEPSFSRRSHGLSRLLRSIPRRRGLEILDLGGPSAANADYFSRLRAQVHPVDLLRAFDDTKRTRPNVALDPLAARDFVDKHLNFSRNQFDGVLAWDVLSFLDSDALHLAVNRLADSVRTGGGLICFFYTQSRGARVPAYRYRIETEDRLLLEAKQSRCLPNTFNNRSLERLFEKFQSVRFFLTRDILREVIVIR